MSESDGVGMQGSSNGKRLGGVTGKGFMPGRSGNPSGKRKGHASLTAALKRSLTSEDARQIALKLIGMAKAGDLGAAKLLFEKLDAAEVEARLCALEVRVSTRN